MEIAREPAITALIIASYILGGIPTGYLVGRAKGIDIRKYGSGNPGTANVYRNLGAAAGIGTLAADFLKGFVPTMLAMGFYLGAGHWWIPVTAGALAIAGHIWTPFLKFRGGKGVATSAGVFSALLPIPTLGAVAVFAIAVALTKHISVGSMAAAVVLPALGFAFESPRPLSIMALTVCALIFYTHIPNMRRILKGEELSYKDGKKKENARG